MPYNGFDISNKVIVVTGGTSGIGRAIALGCAEAGAKVVAGSTNPDKVAAMKRRSWRPYRRRKTSMMPRRLMWRMRPR